MIRVFLLFLMTCDATGHDCRPANGGWYATREACELAKIVHSDANTDGQCVRRWADPK